MALDEAILVCLTERPLSGYELAKTFDGSIGFFWQADHQQIYRTLRRLRERGWVSDELVVQTGKPNKKVYSLTDAGRRRLLEWSQEPTSPPPVRDDMMVRLYALPHVGRDAMVQDIRNRRDHHRRRLDLYRRIEERHYADVDPADVERIGKLLGLHLGVRYESEWVQWCDEALQRLASLPAPQTQPDT